MFVSSWYFSLCASFVPLESMHLLIDKFITRGFSGINEVIIALFLKLKGKIMAARDNQLMTILSNQKLAEMARTLDW